MLRPVLVRTPWGFATLCVSSLSQEFRPIDFLKEHKSKPTILGTGEKPHMDAPGFYREFGGCLPIKMFIAFLAATPIRGS